jgi:predicted solute-binding protein
MLRMQETPSQEHTAATLQSASTQALLQVFTSQHVVSLGGVAISLPGLGL